MNQNIKLEINLPNVPDIELVALEGLELMGKHLGIADDKIGEARILVTEAVINGLEHSGNIDPHVKVEFVMTKEKLTILVTDYGKGFDPALVADPKIDDKITSPNKRGWGLKLMRNMSDNFEIESGPHGTKITLVKKLD